MLTQDITKMDNPTKAIYYLVDGFKLIFQPGLRRFVIIPLLINTFLFIGLFLLSKHFFAEFNDWLTNHLPHGLRWIGSILWLIFFMGYFFVMIYTFITIANFVSAPFNAFLAEKVELYLTGRSLQQQTLWMLMRDVPRLLKRQLAILWYYLPRAIGIIILFFIPVMQIIAALLWFLFNAWMMAMQHIDYPMDNHR